MDSRLNNVKLKCVSAPMSYFGLGDGFGSISLTEWRDGTGYDIEYGDEKFSISADLLRAVNFLADYLTLDVPEM